MKQVRQPFEEEWRDIAKYAATARSRFLNSETNQRRRNVKILDEHGIYAFRTLTAGMTSGLSSPSRPWFTLRTYDDELNEDWEAKAWLSEVERRMYAFLATTNFYGAAKAGYGELGLFGTEACVMVEHRTEGAVCHALTAGEYWIAAGNALKADTLYRRTPMTVSQAVEAFGNAVSPQVMNMYDRSNYHELVPVFQAIEPNTERDPGRIDNRNKPFRSLYWDENDGRKDHLLRYTGYEEQPFWAPRWETVGADVYGYSPGMDCLPSLRELQLQVKRRNQAIDQLVNPETIVPPGVKLTRQPGNTVTAASIDAGQVIVPYQMPYQAVDAIRQEIDRTKQQTDQLSYSDLFMAITNMQGIQPRNVEEIASRNEEKLTQLGPVIERVNNEKLEVAIDRTFGLMERGGLLPPAPEAIQGQSLKVEFVSILTQMQRMVGIGQIERTAGFVGNLAAVFPEAVDKLDVDEMIDEFAERAGAPAKMIRTAEMVKGIRDARAQQQQAEQMAQTMPAVRDGADAARLLSETDVGGTSALDMLVGA
nr:portal protein [Sphingomonas turrisvirgatae]